MVLLILQVVVAVIIIVFIIIIIIAITVFKTKNLFDAISFWFFIGASVNYLLLKPYRHRVGSFNVDRVKNQVGSHTSYLISNIKNIKIMFNVTRRIYRCLKRNMLSESTYKIDSQNTCFGLLYFLAQIL